MSPAIEKSILDALKTVAHPLGEGDIHSRGLVQSLKFEAGKVSLVLMIPPTLKEEAAPLQEKISSALKTVKGVTSVHTVVSAERAVDKQAPAAAPSKQKIPGVRHVIAVASGKGGVGKSTVSINLALALQSLGLKTGLMDADIYGPSLPTLLGLQSRPRSQAGKIEPPLAFGLKVMSMGLLVDTKAPLIWRGPMVASAVRQMLYDVNWHDLDVLVVDMPPGTGDAQLTLAQRVPLLGAVIVSTPQELALIDAHKGLEMFKAIGVPILGFVENMSEFACPHCGEITHVFSSGKVRTAAEQLNVPYLGAIPLTAEMSNASDVGRPLVVANPSAPSAKVFLAVAQKIKAVLN